MPETLQDIFPGIFILEEMISHWLFPRTSCHFLFLYFSFSVMAIEDCCTDFRETFCAFIINNWYLYITEKFWKFLLVFFFLLFVCSLKYRRVDKLFIWVRSCSWMNRKRAFLTTLPRYVNAYTFCNLDQF